MLNALLPGTVVPIHRHPMSNENVICLCGKLVEVLYAEDEITQEGELVLNLACPEALEGKETTMCKNSAQESAFARGMDAQYVMNGKRLKEVERVILDPSTGSFGCVVPAGVWHTVEVLEPSVIYEAKDGKYGEDGSESFQK